MIYYYNKTALDASIYTKIDDAYATISSSHAKRELTDPVPLSDLYQIILSDIHSITPISQAVYYHTRQEMELAIYPNYHIIIRPDIIHIVTEPSAYRQRTPPNQEIKTQDYTKDKLYEILYNIHNYDSGLTYKS